MIKYHIIVIIFYTVAYCDVHVYTQKLRVYVYNKLKEQGQLRIRGSELREYIIHLDSLSNELKNLNLVKLIIINNRLFKIKSCIYLNVSIHFDVMTINRIV